MAAVAAKSNGRGSAPSKPAAKRVVSKKGAGKFTYLPPVNPAMQKLGKFELIAHAELGEKQSIEAGLEMLRRARNRALKAAQSKEA